MELQGKIIAVTGATGFLGSHTALDLLQRGARVRAVVRSPEKAAWLAERGVEVAKADLMDPAALTEAFRGADAVVSNAALYTLKPMPWKAFYEANKVGTENVFDACHAAGVTRVIDISTCGVYRPRLFGWIREDGRRLRERDRYWFPWAYVITKALAEDIAWERAQRYGLDLTVLRPAGIYGPRDTQALPALRWWLRWPVLPVPTFVFPMSHGGDIAAGIRGALENDASVGQAYNLSGEPVSIYRFLQAWKRAMGSGPLLIPLPTPFGMYYANDRAKAELGFTNRPLDEAVRDTLAGDEPKQLAEAG